MAKLNKKKADYLIIFCTLALVVFGFVMLASASSNLAKNQFNDSLYYLKHQAIYGLGLGIVGFFLGMKINYNIYRKIAIPLLLLAIAGLFLIFTPLGFKAGGAERWLKIGAITFQPSELLKIPFIIYLAAWLGGNADRQKNFWRGFVPFLIILGVIVFLLLKQPATSVSVILMLVALIVYFVSGAKISYIISAMAAGAIILALLVYLTPYRWARVMAFLNPETNLQTTGYHVNQTKIAIGVGGLWGVGYGQSTTKIKYLPEPIGDSIFAVIAEELGFIGVISLIGIFFLLVVRIMFLAMKCRDRFGQLLLIGFGSLIMLQCFINIGAISGILPLTGTPLPFISYGGTALAVYMTISGIIVNVSKYA